MGFLDKAKTLADQAVAKADAAMSGATTGSSAKQAEQLLRDLGVLSYLEAAGRAPADASEQRERCLNGLREAEGQGPLNLTIGPASAPPPAPGVAASAPPPPPGAAGGQVAAPPPPEGQAATPQSDPPPPAPEPTGGQVAAPPPPPGSIQPPPPPGGS